MLEGDALVTTVVIVRLVPGRVTLGRDPVVQSVCRPAAAILESAKRSLIKEAAINAGQAWHSWERMQCLLSYCVASPYAHKKA